MTLYICPTPIGNLGDITYRVVETLKKVDVIACEDTSHTRKLLSHYEIKNRLIHYDDHRGEEGLVEVMKLLRAGSEVALVSDAGMPLISDPGHGIIQACLEEGIPFEVLPGPTAFVNAWVNAAMTQSHFSFYGFPPRKQGALMGFLASLKDRPEALIFYEAPHRLETTLKALRDVLGERKIALCRELTKKFEETIRTTTSGALEWLEEGEVRGEFVIVVEGSSEEQLQERSLEEEILYYMELGMSKKDAVKIISKERNMPKREVYQASLDL